MWLIAYGSLMKEKGRLVEVKRLKRIFNKVVSRGIWKKGAEGKKIATLNVVPDEEGSFNAIAIKVQQERLDAFVDREEDYHMERADVYDLETDEKLGACIIFMANEKNKAGEAIIRNDILPVPSYLKACRKAAYSVSTEFGEEFDTATYVADGKRTIREYLKESL